MGQDEGHSTLEHSKRTVNIHLMMIKVESSLWNIIAITSRMLFTSQFILFELDDHLVKWDLLSQFTDEDTEVQRVLGTRSQRK